MSERYFRTVKTKDRLPNLGKRVIFLDSGYKGEYMLEYDPHEKIEIKKGKFIEIMNCHQITDYLKSNFDCWLEEVKTNPYER